MGSGIIPELHPLQARCTIKAQALHDFFAKNANAAIKTTSPLMYGTCMWTALQKEMEVASTSFLNPLGGQV